MINSNAGIEVEGVGVKLDITFFSFPFFSLLNLFFFILLLLIPLLHLFHTATFVSALPVVVLLYFFFFFYEGKNIFSSAVDSLQISFCFFAFTSSQNRQDPVLKINNYLNNFYSCKKEESKLSSI